MKTRIAAAGISLFLALVALAPTTGASVVVPANPASAGCALTNTDSCSTTFVSTAYVFGLAGTFSGTATMTVTSAADPFTSYTITCSGTIVGAVVVGGGCSQGGIYPIGEMTVDCSSVGTGAVTCSVEGV